MLPLLANLLCSAGRGPCPGCYTQKINNYSQRYNLFSPDVLCVLCATARCYWHVRAILITIWNLNICLMETEMIYCVLDNTRASAMKTWVNISYLRINYTWSNVKELNSQIALYRINHPSTSPNYIRIPNPVITVFADLLAYQQTQ